jgi:uncharacterized damage-inducible protein DinB
MSIGTSMLAEFDREMATTRRVLDRVPSDKGTWKPHEKSFALGHLAQLVSWMPGWITTTIREPDLDLKSGGGYSFQPTETLVAQFDKNVGEARAELAKVRDEAFDEPWSLKMGDHVIWTESRGVVVRTHISHLVHHRGQLTVYLRLLDVPVPSIYGPTADERTFG